MKTPITYYGGKQQLTPVIIPMLEYVSDATTYVEPFFGGGAVFFAKQPHKVEVINDKNGEVVNFYKVVQSQFRQLDKRIKYTLHSRELHRQARVIYDNPDMFGEVERAWAFWTLANQSFSSNLIGGWGYGKIGNNCEKKLKNKRSEFTIEYKKRMEQVQIECTDAVKVIESRDHEHAIHYCDPPYMNANQGHYSGYTEDEFKRLLNALKMVKGKFLLSGYPSDILKKHTNQNGWFTVKIEANLRVTHLTNKTKTEVLTANYDITKIYADLTAGKGA